MLLDHPFCKVNLRGMDGFTALIRACQDSSDIVALLLSRPDTDINIATYYGTTALTYGIRYIITH
jgi:ankyrin repeat protein